MGCYVNPENETKEAWLEREGRPATQDEIIAIREGRVVENFLAKGVLPVVVVNNGLFTAAGVLYSDREAIAFSDPTDYRPKSYFVATLEKLRAVSPLDYYLKK